MEINKITAAVLTAGIAFFLTGTIGDLLVSVHRPKEAAIKIEGAPAEAAPAAAPAEKLPPIGPLLASADPGAGEGLVKKLCSACHTFDEGGKAGVGPNLYGVVGGPHAHMAGFNYSDALKSKQGPWTFEELNEWLHKPSAYAPGTRMAFAGIGNDKQRADVIAYLRSLSHNPQPLPAAEASSQAPGAQNQPQTPSTGAGAPPGAGGNTSPSAGAATSPQSTAPSMGAAGPGSPTPPANKP
jgi:cytochrome c